jgi:signal transduction histidine kinase
LKKYEDEKGQSCAEQASHERISGEEFFKGLIHEFTNMLTAVIGYSELALEAVEHSHPVRNWLEKIRSHTKELSLMVRKLTALNQKSETNNQQ